DIQENLIMSADQNYKAIPDSKKELIRQRSTEWWNNLTVEEKEQLIAKIKARLDKISGQAAVKGK
ncbi:MAG: hypothetical protein ABSA34_05185, partial [Candidatus Goldiibacteriota bacterium]